MVKALKEVLVMGFVLRYLKRVRRWAAGPAALLAGFSAHGLTALVVLAALVVVLAVLGRGMLRWTISSGARSDRMIRMILALRGDGRSPAESPSALSSPGPRQHRQPSVGGHGDARQPADCHEQAKPDPQGDEKVDGPLRQQEAVGMVKASQKGPHS
jgi:hypothetical protein